MDYKSYCCHGLIRNQLDTNGLHNPTFFRDMTHWDSFGPIFRLAVNKPGYNGSSIPWRPVASDLKRADARTFSVELGAGHKQGDMTSTNMTQAARTVGQIYHGSEKNALGWLSPVR